MMDKNGIYQLSKLSERAGEFFWEALISAGDGKQVESDEAFNQAKGHIQALHEALFPEQYENVTSEVAAQNRANDVKHEMD